ncbi:MAG: hypothetical protein K9N46_12990 [Candidatus Marinimicrobia bacterium]|nr:hypothetical protein [Candidatus Neomarinimicrobiota bacterium]MCF7829698.1 hypothetical protein [Candidatus Neomarinimicrobiota bacterium]MCF7881648.1 hypothetical protein [Candidatus Neomarinimicrobiota bacterium]
MQKFVLIVAGLLLLFQGTVSAQSVIHTDQEISTIGFKYLQPGERVQFQQQQPELERMDAPVSKKKAVFASLILPGWGERLLGVENRGAIFSSTETALWLGFIGFTAYGNWREQDFKSYATHKASVNPAGKDGQYWIDIAGYDNIREYNEVQLRDREPDRVYPNTSEYQWNWESFNARYRYDTMRIDSRKSEQYATFVIGAIVFNHLASALDVTYLYNTRFLSDGESMSYSISVPLQ